MLLCVFIIPFSSSVRGRKWVNKLDNYCSGEGGEEEEVVEEKEEVLEEKVEGMEEEEEGWRRKRRWWRRKEEVVNEEE